MIAMGRKGKLYTTGEIADRLGVGRQRAYVVTRSKGFPDPYEEWEDGSAVWRIEDFDRWYVDSPYAKG